MRNPTYKRVTERYVLLADTDAKKLTYKVNAHLEQGFRQWGSPMINPTTAEYTQAVVIQ